MNTSPFQNTPEGLRAENQSIRLLLSPIHNRFLIDGGVLVEETECNLLLRHVKEESDFQLSINGKPATKPIYLQDGSTVWGRLVSELALAIFGTEALAYGHFADNHFRMAMTAGVAVGTTEINLNLVASRFLGLPRE